MGTPEARPSSLCCTDAHLCSLTVCAMLLQESESKIAALDFRLKKEQEERADAVKVSAAQAALLPAGTPSHDHRLRY